MKIKFIYTSLLALIFCSAAYAMEKQEQSTIKIKKLLLDKAATLNPNKKIKKVFYVQGTVNQINTDLTKNRNKLVEAAKKATKKGNWVRILYYDGTKFHHQKSFNPNYMLTPSLSPITNRGVLIYAVPQN